MRNDWAVQHGPGLVAVCATDHKLPDHRFAVDVIHGNGEGFASTRFLPVGCFLGAGVAGRARAAGAVLIREVSCGQTRKVHLDAGGALRRFTEVNGRCSLMGRLRQLRWTAA